MSLQAIKDVMTKAGIILSEGPDLVEQDWTEFKSFLFHKGFDVEQALMDIAHKDFSKFQGLFDSADIELPEEVDELDIEDQVDEAEDFAEEDNVEEEVAEEDDEFEETSYVVTEDTEEDEVVPTVEDTKE